MASGFTMLEPSDIDSVPQWLTDLNLFFWLVLLLKRLNPKKCVFFGMETEGLS